MIRSYEDLVMYQKADGLAHAIYDAAQSFPWEELFGLTAQLKRAAVSVPANIAEGSERGRLRFSQKWGYLGGKVAAGRLKAGKRAKPRVAF